MALSYHSSPASVVYPCKRVRDVYLHKWVQYLHYVVPRYRDTQHDQEWLRHAIHWCLYFAGKRESMP